MSADPSQALSDPPANAPLRVLVVDDEELARMRMKSLVAECSEPSAVVVGEAANAAQALVWLATRQCDLLLLDVQMPGRDGSLGTLLAIDSTARPSLTFVRTRMTPPSGDGSTPWRTAFSTSGCRISGGTRADAAFGSSSQATCRRLPKRICSMSR